MNDWELEVRNEPTIAMEDCRMFETLDKMMLAGLGAVSMTRERAEQMFDEYVNKGQAERDNRSGFVKEVMDSAERTRSELEKMISKQVQETVTTLHLATQEDIQRIEEKLDQLLAKG
jgi:polyhydroxyalkanoate synthesis regulator phasin